MEFKYEIDTRVKTSSELVIYHTDDESGEEYETVIPVGANGVIESHGWSSTEGFRPRYDVLFKLPDNEISVSFFEPDFEENCIVEQ
jgi:hypothetical protein